MANIAWRSAAVTNDFSFAQTAAVGNRPTGVTANDGLVAVTAAYGIAPASAPTVTPPSGWTQLGTADTFSLSGGSFNIRVQYWTKLAGGSEPSTYTWTLSAAGGWQVEIVAVDNVKTSGFVQGRTAINVGTGTAVQALGLTTDQTNQYVLMFAATGATASFTAPGTMTERYNVANTFIADEQRATPGATGTRTATASASGEWTAWLVALYSEDSAPPSSGPPMAVLRHHYALMQRR